MRANFNETLLNLAAHPLIWGMARLARRMGPVWRVPGLGVLISDAELGREILQRDDDFPKNGPGSFAEAFTAALGPVALGNMDGIEHKRLRTALAGVLTPSRAEQLVHRHSASLDSLRSQLVCRGGVDLTHFIRGWSGRIVFDVVGIAPPPGREDEASHDIVNRAERMASVLGFRQMPERDLRAVQADCERLAAWFRDGYRQPAPQSSLADRLQTLGYSFEQARGIVLIFVIAGTLTITTALPRIVAMLVDSGLFAQLADDPAGIPQAIDEGLRFIAPLPATIRIVQHDTVVRGHRLTAGTRLVILTCNLARDAKLFPDPDRFDISRVHDPRARRLWYGAGPHYCAGFNLAQCQLKAVLESLASASGNLTIVKRRIGIAALLPGYRELWVQSVATQY